MSDLTGKQRAFIDQWFLCDFNGTEAAGRAGYKGDRATLAEVASQNLRNLKIRAAIEARLAERTMSADEVLIRLAEHARGSLGDVLTFNTVRRSTTILKPAGEVIAEIRATIAFEDAVAERADLSEEELASHKREMVHLRRRILRLELQLDLDPDATAEGAGPVVEELIPVLDLAKAERDGKLQLVKSYNAKDGRVELYDAHAALELIGRHHHLFPNKIEHSGTISVADAEQMSDEELDEEMKRRGLL